MPKGVESPERKSEVNPRIRRLINAIFRAKASIREYFAYSHNIHRPLKHFGLEKLWEQVYEIVITGDFESDRPPYFWTSFTGTIGSSSPHSCSMP